MERGRRLAGTCWSEARTDLIGGVLRQHTKGDLHARVLKQPREGQQRTSSSCLGDKEDGALLGHISQETC